MANPKLSKERAVRIHAISVRSAAIIVRIAPRSRRGLVLCSELAITTSHDGVLPEPSAAQTTVGRWPLTGRSMARSGKTLDGPNQRRGIDLDRAEARPIDIGDENHCAGPHDKQQ